LLECKRNLLFGELAFLHDATSFSNSENCAGFFYVSLEQALIARYGTLGRVTRPFLLRSDNGPIFNSISFTALVRIYGLKQKFITPDCPEQNGIVEQVIRSLKEQCTRQQQFETLQHASRVISDWIHFYNHRRPHQALRTKTPAQTYGS